MKVKPEAIDLAALPSLPLEQRSCFPQVSCIYFAIDSLGVIFYIGRTGNLCRRWCDHHRIGQLKQIEGIKIAWLQVSEPSLLPEIERAMIRWFTPVLNKTNIPGSEDGRNRTGINLNEAMAEKIRALAEKERRSLTAQVHVLLEFALSRWGDGNTVTPEWIKMQFDKMGREKVAQLVFSAIKYLLSAPAADTNSSTKVIAYQILQKGELNK